MHISYNKPKDLHRAMYQDSGYLSRVPISASQKHWGQKPHLSFFKTRKNGKMYITMERIEQQTVQHESSI